MKKTIIITGASGMIGHALLQLLWNCADTNVVAIYNKRQASIRGRNITHVSTDLAVESAFDRIRLDPLEGIIHSAARVPSCFGTSEESDCSKENRLIDKTVTNFAEYNKIPLVYISSSALYGQSSSSDPINERTTINPKGKYAEQKADSETAIRQAELPAYSILRIVAPYGPWQRTEPVLRLFLHNAIEGKDILYFGSGSRQQTFTFSLDVARAALLALRKRSNGTYNIAGSESISMLELAGRIAKIVHSSSEIKAADQADPQEGLAMRYDTSLARDELNWKPAYTLDDGLSEMADWIRGQGR